MADARTLPVLGPVAVLALLAGACALPAGYYQGKFLEEGIAADGLGALIFGWSTFVLGASVGLAWFANPVLAVGLIYQWRRQYAAAARCAAVAVALGLLPLAELLVDWRAAVRWWPTPALMFEHEWPLARAELRAGYFVWLAAHGVLLAVAAVCWYWGPRADPGEAEPPRHVDDRQPPAGDPVGE